MAKIETILVSFNPTEKEDTALLLVGKQKPLNKPDIINTFQGKEAVELYNKLTTPTELMGK